MEEKKPIQTHSWKSEALEEFISELESHLFNSHNVRKVKYNLTKEENTCLKTSANGIKMKNALTCLELKTRGHD